QIFTERVCMPVLVGRSKRSACAVLPSGGKFLTRKRIAENPNYAKRLFEEPYWSTRDLRDTVEKLRVCGLPSCQKSACCYKTLSTDKQRRRVLGGRTVAHAHSAKMLIASDP